MMDADRSMLEVVDGSKLIFCSSYSVGFRVLTRVCNELNLGVLTSGILVMMVRSRQCTQPS